MKRIILSIFLASGLMSAGSNVNAMLDAGAGGPEFTLAPTPARAPRSTRATQPKGFWDCVYGVGTTVKETLLWTTQPIRNHPKKVITLIALAAAWYLYPEKCSEYATRFGVKAMSIGKDLWHLAQRHWYGEEAIRKLERELTQCLFEGHAKDATWKGWLAQKMPWAPSVLKRCLAETMIKNPDSPVCMAWLRERIPGIFDALKHCGENPMCMHD